MDSRTARLQITRFRLKAVLSVCLLALLLVLPACGGNSDDDPTTTTTSAEPTSTTAVDSTPPEPTATDAAPTESPAEPTETTTTAPDPSATSTTPAEPAATQTAASEEIVLSVFFIRDEKIATVHRSVPRTQQVAAAAMAELLAGPTVDEAALGMTTAIPDGTEYLGTTINQGTATVDLSGEFESGGGSFSVSARLAQVVYTLTQFPTVDFVIFTLDGEPVEVFSGEGLILDRPASRQDFEDFTPLIFVASPAINDIVSSPLRVFGTANTFEAAFMLQLLDADGGLILEQPMMATSGSGTRGTFDMTIGFNAPSGSQITLRVFEHSAKDGSEVNVVEIPLVVE